MLTKVFEEYGDAIKIVVVALLLIAIAVVLLNVDGPVKKAFSDLLTDFFGKATTKASLLINFI